MAEEKKPLLQADPENGWKTYLPQILDLYDDLVLVDSNSRAWLCPTEKLIELYRNNMGREHLDVGVGTGFFLQEKHVPETVSRIDLMDLNRNCIERAKGVIKSGTEIETFETDIRQPILGHPRKYDSIAINYLLHCLPGRLEDKMKVFDHLVPLLNPEGVIFGSTIFGKGVVINERARELLDKYNSLKTFSNLNDDPNTFEKILRSKSKKVNFEVFGCVGVFSLKLP